MRLRRRGASVLFAVLLATGAGAALGGAALGGEEPAVTDVAGRASVEPAAEPGSGPAQAAPGGQRPGFARSLALDADGEPLEGVADDEQRAPAEVLVPRIGVDTPLVRLGIAADGSLEVPGRGEFDRAGWLTTSALPGDAGATVVAGHVDSTSGPAVFYRLHELVPGDEVRVVSADGGTTAYTVDEVRRVGKDAFPTAEVYGPQPGPVLRLITCGGAFDRATGHYTDNVIAFASAA